MLKLVIQKALVRPKELYVRTMTFDVYLSISIFCLDIQHLQNVQGLFMPCNASVFDVVRDVKRAKEPNTRQELSRIEAGTENRHYRV